MDSAPAPSRFKRHGYLAWRIVRIPSFCYVGLVIVMMFLENSLIYFPAKHPIGDWDPPGLAFEDAWFTSADGTKLHGWFVPHENPRAIALFTHGNAGNVSTREDRLEYLHSVGLAVLVFDYRGYGRSEGSPNESGVLADARAARRWLAERTGVSERQIVLIGESLGGAVAVDLAANDGAAGLVLESTFTSLPDVAAYHYPWLPARLLMRSRLDALSQIAKYQGPLLWSHGMADEIIPYELGRKLFEAANEPKEGIDRPGCYHNGPPHPEHDAPYREAMERFLARVEAGRQTATPSTAEASAAK